MHAQPILYRNPYLPLLLLLIWQLGGCTTPLKVSTDYDDQFDFKSQSSYALIQPEKIENAPNDLTKQRIESALKNALDIKGLTLTKKDQADIWVSYFATSEKQQDVQTFHNYNHFYGYANCFRCYQPIFPVMTTEVYVTDYTEGTLMVDFIDPKSNTLKWRGMTKSKIATSRADEMTVDERIQTINEAVNVILNQYPPSKNTTKK